ncbi:MAG TPA: 8-amino-7-oxononanoate synthase, partial [Moraxellaceae bacterium]|nr:8-amino-7-oxononanoate synthase [Moraxellaceae bacterium]
RDGRGRLTPRHRTATMGFDLEGALAQKRQAGLYRRRRLIGSAQGSRLLVDGRELLNFCSNDYLGLAADPRLTAAFTAAAQRWGTGSGASHLVCGHSVEHHALEEELAAFTGRERVLLFSTGYMANTGIVQALLRKEDAVFEDELNHASLIDGGRLARCDYVRYGHNDVADLERKLKASTAERKLVVTDGVFSMDGDVAPLRALAQAARAHDAWLMVDDAHGFGVLGATGGGVAEALALGPAELPVLVGTLGKAFGTFGAFVAGSEALVEYLINSARSYIFTTALPPAVAAATRESLRIVREGEELRARLNANIAHFRHEAGRLGLALMDSDTPIQPVILGGNERALAWSAALQERGLLVGAIRPPTVPAGTARLRVTLTAGHARPEIDRLLEGLAACRREVG